MKPEKLNRKITEAETQIAEHDRVIATLEAQRAAELRAAVEAETRATTARQILDKMTPAELERIEPEALDLLKVAAPDAYKAMGERLVQLDPSRHLRHEMDKQLAVGPQAPEVMRAFGGDQVALEDAELLALVETAASRDGVLPLETLARLSPQQVRDLKSSSEASVYWRSANALADAGGRTIARVQP